MRTRELDCLIIGGGPAGSVLAMLLAKRGIEVALVDAGRAHYSGPYETVLASSRSAWQRMGLLDAATVDGDLQCGIAIDTLRHGAVWGSPELVWREGDEAGLLLHRGAFDQSLRAAARRAGALVFEGVRAMPRGTGWLLHGMGADPSPTLWQPKRLVYATGRSTVEGLPPRIRSGPATTAVTVLGTPDPDDRGTAIVEAVADGWMWSHVPRAGVASTALFVDRHRPDGQALESVFANMFTQARGPAQRMRDWRIAQANDASLWHRAAAGDALVLGDAATTIDPLASQGVEKAISAAEHASVVIATSLQQASWWPRLCAMHHRWEVGLQAAHQRSAAAFYQQEVRFATQPFWRQRQLLSPGETIARADLHDSTWQVLPTVKLARVLMRHGARIIEVDGAVNVATGEELARIASAAVAPVLELFAKPTTVAAALASAGQSARLFVLSPQEVQEAIWQLRQRGWLRAMHRDPTSLGTTADAGGTR